LSVQISCSVSEHCTLVDKVQGGRREEKKGKCDKQRQPTTDWACKLKHTPNSPLPCKDRRSIRNIHTTHGSCSQSSALTASKLTTSNNKDGEQTRACNSESSAQIEGAYTVVDNSIDYKRIATGT